MRAGCRLSAAAVGLALLLAACSDGALIDPTPDPTTSPASTAAESRTTTTGATTSTTAAPETTVPESTAPESTAPDPTPASSTSTTGPEATTFRIATAADPLLIWVIGDSLAWTLGHATRDLAEATGAAEVVIDNEGGSGLARPDFFHWPIFVSERMPEIQPEVVVITIGANDGQAILAPGDYLEFGTPEWIERYNREVGDFMDLLTYACEHVYWVGPPSMRENGLDQRVRMIGDLHRAQAELRPRVTYLDAYALFVDEAGEYAQQLRDASGSLVVMREPDGVHYTWEGGYHLARAVLDTVAADWGFADLPGE